MGDYLDRWHTWEATTFLPEVWVKAPDTIRSLLLPPAPSGRITLHLRNLEKRVELTTPEQRIAWRGPLLWAFTVLRESPLPLLAQLRPVVVLECGELCRAQDLCLDL